MRSLRNISICFLLPRTNIEKSSVLKCLFCLFANLSSRQPLHIRSCTTDSFAFVYTCYCLHAWLHQTHGTHSCTVRLQMPLSIFNSYEIISETILCKFVVWLFKCSLKSFTLLSFQMTLSLTIGTPFTWVMSQFILNVTCIGAWNKEICVYY